VLLAKIADPHVALDTGVRRLAVCRLNGRRAFPDRATYETSEPEYEGHSKMRWQIEPADGAPHPRRPSGQGFTVTSLEAARGRALDLGALCPSARTRMQFGFAAHKRKRARLLPWCHLGGFFLRHETFPRLPIALDPSMFRQKLIRALDTFTFEAIVRSTHPRRSSFARRRIDLELAPPEVWVRYFTTVDVANEPLRRPEPAILAIVHPGPG
jgi:hypothetical protein